MWVQTTAIWHGRDIQTYCYRLTSGACTWTADSHVHQHTHGEGLNAIFMLFQLLRAQSLPAGCVWSHRDAVHLSEEEQSHWDLAASVLSAWRHPLSHAPLPLTFCLSSSCYYHFHLPVCITPLSPMLFYSFLPFAVVFDGNLALFRQQFCCKCSIWMSFAILQCKAMGTKVLMYFTPLKHPII